MRFRHSQFYFVFNNLYKYITVRFHDKRTLYYDIRSILGFYPNSISLYERAFIHRSAASITHIGTVVNNERLEYLGDAILSAVVAEYLFYKFPDQKEGFLTQMRSKMVNRDMLSTLALKIGLDQFIVSNIRNLKQNKNINGDAFEAFIGALYLDKGYWVTRKFIIKNLVRTHIDVKELTQTDTNYKSQIIEWAQKYRKEIVFDTQEMPDNPRMFIGKAVVDGITMGEGTGVSKKEAEQNAAENALTKVSVPSVM